MSTFLWVTSSWIISHFGINPVSGGRPPRDNNVRKIIMVIGVDLVHRLLIDLILVVEEKFSVRNRVSVGKI